MAMPFFSWLQKLRWAQPGSCSGRCGSYTVKASCGLTFGQSRSMPSMSCALRKGVDPEQDLCNTVSLQMQPNTSLYIENPEPQSLEPVPKKRRTEQMKSLPDLKEAKDFCGSYSSHSFKFPEELEEPYDASTQVWKACFNYVAERGFHFHENLGSPGSPEGLVAAA